MKIQKNNIAGNLSALRRLNRLSLIHISYGPVKVDAGMRSPPDAPF